MEHRWEYCPKVRVKPREGRFDFLSAKTESDSGTAQVGLSWWLESSEAFITMGLRWGTKMADAGN